MPIETNIGTRVPIGDTPALTIPTIPGLTITSSAKIVSPNTKLAMLLWALSGMGKTNLAGSLDRLTQQFEQGRRVLYIPVELGEGGGAATIRKLGIPMFVPKDLSELMKALGSLYNDKQFAGVVLDSASELTKNHVKASALRYPPRENIETRKAGVPTRSDYQVMGELTSQVLRALLNLTTHPQPEYRKHVVVTALEKEREEGEQVVWRGPDLPGRMATEAAANFQLVGTIRAKTSVEAGKRTVSRYLLTSTNGVDALKDRFELMPPEIRLAKTYSDGSDGEDLASLWEKYWYPAMKEQI